MSAARFSTVLLFMLAGCGPSVLVAGGDGSSTAADQATTADSTTGSAEPTTGPVGTTSSEGSTAIATTTGGSADAASATTSGQETDETAESSSGDPMPCGCESQAIDVLANVEGTTPLDAIANLGETAFALNWLGLAEATPSTTATLTLSHQDGLVLLHPGGDNGCGFLPSPCPTGLEIAVTAQLVSSDGILDGTFEATLLIPEPSGGPDDATLLTGPLGLEAFGGTLATQSFVDDRGVTTDLVSGRYRAVWNASTLELSDLTGEEILGDVILLGSSL